MGEAQINKSLNRSRSLIYSQPQESERSAIKTLASQHLRDLQAMHEQFSQDIQAVRDQHKDVRNNHKKEMKELEIKRNEGEMAHEKEMKQLDIKHEDIKVVGKVAEQDAKIKVCEVFRCY